MVRWAADVIAQASGRYDATRAGLGGCGEARRGNWRGASRYRRVCELTGAPVLLLSPSHVAAFASSLPIFYK